MRPRPILSWLRRSLLAVTLLAVLASAARGAGGAPDTCIVDGIVFEECPLEVDPLLPGGPGGGLLGVDPDLSARGGGFILVPAQIAAGQQFTANAVIENLGGLHFSPTEIRVDFYLSPLGDDALLPQNFLGSTEIVFPVVTSASIGEVGVLVSRSGQLPAIAPGQYRLAIDIDADDAIEELSELNNAVAAGETITVGGGPDLVPLLTGFSVTTPVEQGGPAILASTVRNAGSGGIAGPANFTVRYRAVPAGGDELGGTVLGLATVNVPGGTSLAAGASRAVPSLQVPVSLPPGEYQIAVDVDFSTAANGAIAEADEDNNSRLLGAMIVQAAASTGFPDYEFRLAQLTHQEGDPLGVGHRLFIDVKLVDPGPNLLPQIFPPIRIVASDDATIGPTDTTLRNFPQVTDFYNQNILTQQVSLVVPWPAGIPAGSYFVGAIIDPDNHLAHEPDKSNNTALVGQVTTAVLCPRLPKPGQAETVFDDVFTRSQPLPGFLVPPVAVEGAYCHGVGLRDDYDFFYSPGDSCHFFAPYFEAKQYVELELLPAMQRACVTTLDGLLAASKPDTYQVVVAAFRLKSELEWWKAFCDGEPATAHKRRYCSCSNPDFLSWAPPPGPGECFYFGPHP
jgi:hypothetical protein